VILTDYAFARSIGTSELTDYEKTEQVNSLVQPSPVPATMAADQRQNPNAGLKHCTVG
jgi:hypothetical protein